MLGVVICKDAKSFQKNIPSFGIVAVFDLGSAMTVEFSELLAKALRGCEKSLSALMAAYGEIVRSECARVQVSEFGDLSATDLTQEAWIRIWSRLDQFQGGSDQTIAELRFRKWLRQVSRSTSLNLLEARAAQKRNPKARFERPDCQEVEDPQAETASRLAAKDEEQEALTRVLSQLDAVSQDVVIKKVVDGLSHEEISNRTGLTRDQVRYKLRSALDTLGRNLP